MRGEIVYTSGPVEIEARVPGPEDVRLLRGFARPFAEGTSLWLKSLSSLCVGVPLPVGAVMGLLAMLGFEALQRLAAARRRVLPAHHAHLPLRHAAFDQARDQRARSAGSSADSHTAALPIRSAGQAWKW